MEQVGEDLVDIDGPNPDTAVARLKPQVRKLAWQLLGPPPEYKDKTTKEETVKPRKEQSEPAAKPKKPHRKKATKAVDTGNNNADEPVPISPGPLMQQYQEAKARHPGMMILFRAEGFFELFDEDAKTGAKLLGLTLTTRDKTVAMTGFPHHKLETYLKKLLQAGHRVAICEPVIDAKTVKREVSRIVVPGQSAPGDENQK